MAELRCNTCKHHVSGFCAKLKEGLPNDLAKLFYGGAISPLLGRRYVFWGMRNRKRRRPRNRSRNGRFRYRGNGTRASIVQSDSEKVFKQIEFFIAEDDSISFMRHVPVFVGVAFDV
jgi:hypothetical protein